jgi:AraC-like DNA-binding protein/predicted transcriptional regulator YdeE
MNYLRQIQRGLDYIEAHLSEDLLPGDVARHAGISQWHFQRIFKSLTNETLKTYIRSRRFAAALTMLDDADVPLIHIALASGFDTQESFTRAFKKAFDVTPGAYRKSRRAMRFQRKARFDAEYLHHLHENVSLQPELSDQPALRLVGMITRCVGADSDKANFARAQPALWNDFLPRVGELERADPSKAYGVVRVPREGDELEYLAAFEVHRSASVPAGMVSVELPPAQYAKFAHKGPLDRLDQTLNYVYSSWLLTSGMRHTSGCDVELYDERFVPNSESSLIHYAIPVTPGDPAVAETA